MPGRALSHPRMNSANGTATIQSSLPSFAAATARSLPVRRKSSAKLRAMINGRKATLLTATRELELSHAVVLRELLEGKS